MTAQRRTVPEPRERFETYAHGTDIGVRGIGGSAESAIEQTACALTSIVTDPESADLVMTGEIKDLRSGGALLDDTGRTRVFQVVVVAGITLRDRVKEKVLFDNQRMVFRGEYELAGDPESFFNEESSAVDRIAQEFATSVVSTILLGGM